MGLTNRQNVIFKTIVEEFTRTAEPIGSKTLMNLLDFPVSSATIRNEMAALEKVGLLEKTHTSSGRIPSSKGYRYYVENLLETNLDVPMQQTLKTYFTQRHYSIDDVVSKSCDILSEMTNLTSIALGPDCEDQCLQHVQLVPVNEKSAVAIIVTNKGHTENKFFQFKEEVSTDDLKKCTDLLNDKLVGTPICQVVDRMNDIHPIMAATLVRHEVLFEAFVTAFMKFAQDRIKVSGRGNMLFQPEFSDLNRLKELMNVLENGHMIKEWTNKESNVSVRIGNRKELTQIGDCSIISAKFHYSDSEEGQLMVVGPNRMQYSKVVGLMDYMTNVIEDIFYDDKNKGGGNDE
ncbi:MAG: heat-inducible transcriptional repressor HrcA [Floccifex porci]|uniref:Heat-inducible transcription repressor HrcA n=1 Tax=Floccifex porci TaxID=2606629 RepID=A0A7X2N1R0_9FIRM|nr:heat-inducible transcriptional repressor HrcA [Floccifex porci]MCI7802098.1 heat-inducible transcriptional repressor HrcA [Erysipelotrichaceae bacterium]MDD7466552.1 heat-inducible transcriptional repressor HrcA [Floccifex porci]MDY4796572.1 heat-inducible transcriptional repressor HrcA [Floccifex porci]MSS00841.1 heat-inducible transcription repressor HrcA [Floccifex porci]